MIQIGDNEHVVSWAATGWLFAIAVTLHNLEEAVWLPSWSQVNSGWRFGVGAGVFRFGTALLTLFAYLCAFLSARKSLVGTYLLCGYAQAMLLNVVFPHVIATVVTRRYAPGTGTSLLLNLPVTWWLLHRALVERRIDARMFAWAGPLVVAGILAFVVFLFFVGNRLRRAEVSGR